MDPGVTPWLRTKWAILPVITEVLPVPAPARTRVASSSVATACACSSVSGLAMKPLTVSLTGTVWPVVNFRFASARAPSRFFESSNLSMRARAAWPGLSNWFRTLGLSWAVSLLMVSISSAAFECLMNRWPENDFWRFLSRLVISGLSFLALSAAFWLSLFSSSAWNWRIRPSTARRIWSDSFFCRPAILMGWPVFVAMVSPLRSGPSSMVRPAMSLTGILLVISPW